MDEPEPPSFRYTLPDRLRSQARTCGRGIEVVSSVQRGLAKAACTILAVGAPFVMHTFGVLHIASLVVVLLLGLAGLLAWQAGALETVGQQFDAAGRAGTHAHVALEQGFGGLPRVLLLDAVIAAVMSTLLAGVLLWW